MHTLKTPLARALAFVLCLLPLTVSAATYDGYGRNATGGAGGTSVTATTAAQFKTYAESATTYIITVSGTIDLAGTNIAVKSNKTIQGANTSATIKNGTLQLSGINNVVIQKLNITNPNGDGVSCWGASNVFCTKVNFYDCGDGSFDITQGGEQGHRLLVQIFLSHAGGPPFCHDPRQRGYVPKLRDHAPSQLVLQPLRSTHALR